MAEPAPEKPVVKKTTAKSRTIWLGMARLQRLPSGQQRVRIRWLTMLFYLVGGAAVMWLLAALGLYFFFKMVRGFEDERYMDVVTLPFHLQEHNHKMGEYYISIADKHFEAMRWDDAMKNYRLGVMKAPEDLEARTRLAALYSIYYKKDISISLAVLEDGLPYALDKNPEYVTAYLQHLVAYHFPEKIVSVCKQYLAKKLTNDEVRKIFAVNLVSEYIDQGDFPEAEQAMAAYKLNDGLDGVFMNARLLWESGRKNSAVELLEKALQTYPDNPQIHIMLSGFYRDMGKLDLAEQHILSRAISQINNVGPRIDLLYIHAKEDKKDMVAKEEQDIINQFKTDREAMRQLADFASNEGDPILTRRILEVAVSNPAFNSYIPNFCISHIEALITAKDYEAAGQFIENNIEKTNPPWYSDPHIRAIIDSLRAVANYGIGRVDLADIFLTSLLKEAIPRPDNLTSIANRFYSLGAYPEAQSLLEVAYNTDPHSQTILSQLITVELQLGTSTDLGDNLRALMKTRHPNLALLLDAYRKLGSDRFIFVPQREQLLDELYKYVSDASALTQQTES